MTDTKTGKAYFGGLSTDVEVKALMEHYQQPQEGAVLPYEDIEALIGVERDKSRFKSVLNRYRQQMERLHGVIFAAMPKIGLRVLTPQECVDRNAVDFGHKIKGALRAGDRTARIPRERLSADDASRADALQLMSAKVSQTFLDGRPAIKPPEKAAAAPRLQLVNGKE